LKDDRQQLVNEVLLRLCNAQLSTRSGNGMRGIVAYALIAALMAVADAAFFNGRYLKDIEDTIRTFAAISTALGRR
jgi:hypothetical protein